MPQVMDYLGGDGTSQRRELWILIGLCIVGPLCCPRKFEALRFTSAMCVCFVIVLAIMVFFYSLGIPALDPCQDVDAGDECRGERVAVYLNVDTLRVFSIFIFAFSCQTNIFCVTNELRRPTLSRYDSVINGAVSLTTTLYALVAVCGYSTYGYDVESNVLESYPCTSFSLVQHPFLYGMQLTA